MELAADLVKRQKQVLDALQRTWSEAQRIEWTSGPTWPKDHPLGTQFAAFARGAPCSLPYVTRSRVNWVTFGGSQLELFEAIDDLRAWMFPNFGREDIPALVGAQTARPPLGEVLISISPSGYFRWWCPKEAVNAAVSRLAKQSRFLSTRPDVSSTRVPSLAALRLEFVAWLRTGEWGKATAAIDAIDRWQLDTARNTELMRVRLSYERGDLQEVLNHVDRKRLLEIAVPKRILSMILDAVYRVELEAVEKKVGWRASVKTYANDRHAMLADAIVAASSSLRSHPLVAYRAFVDKDHDVLSTLTQYGEKPLLTEMLQALEPPRVSEPPLPVYKTPTSSGTAPSIATGFWDGLTALIRAGNQTSVRDLVGSIESGLLEDAEWISCGAEALVEIFTDPAIASDVRKSLIAQEAFTSIVEAVTGIDEFPKRDHGLMYVSLVTTWVIATGASLADDDGQMLLGLVAAAMQCSSDAVPQCESAILDYWSKRKVASRLGWLVRALETLLYLHPNPANLQGVWLEAADIAVRQKVALSSTERSLWRRLGYSVELDSALVDSLVREPASDFDHRHIDVLTSRQFKKIAVVTLQERAGRQAAEELRARTGADVILVNALAAGPLTRAAESADLILLVWAACKHAVSRAFDHVRDRVSYVQGTGPSSIVLAAETWAEKNTPKH